MIQLVQRALYVDYKAVFHISVYKPLESLVDIVHFNDLNLWVYFV